VARQPTRRSAVFYENPINSIGYLTRITFRSFSRTLERRTLPYGVSSGQWRFLRVLWNEDGLTQRELSRRVGMREPTTVTAVDSMEKSGFVRRIPSEEDRRKIHVFLTPKAKRLRSKLMPFVEEVNVVAAQGLSPAEVATLRRMLLKMMDNLSKEEAEYAATHGGPAALPLGSAIP
jgi:MarR family transcriptional regulator, transcriptional regulator for hemolysin